VKSLLLLGEEHPGLGELHLAGEGPFALALSAGHSSSASAHNKVLPNEDGLLLCAGPERALLAVADGHFGAAAHQLLRHLHDSCKVLPTRLSELARLLLQPFPPPAQASSGTTLLIAVVDRATRRVFGFSFGDCLLISVHPEEGPVVRNRLNNLYLYGGQPIPLEESESFQFTLSTGSGLLLCSDGVHECCYQAPSRSLQKSHIQRGFLQSQGSPKGWVEWVARTALEGVDGHPGGQDNLAILGWCLDG